MKINILAACAKTHLCEQRHEYNIKMHIVNSLCDLWLPWAIFLSFSFDLCVIHGLLPTYLRRKMLRYKNSVNTLQCFGFDCPTLVCPAVSSVTESFRSGHAFTQPLKTPRLRPLREELKNSHPAGETFSKLASFSAYTVTYKTIP